MSEPLTLFITSPTTGDTVPMCLRADYNALTAERNALTTDNHALRVELAAAHRLNGDLVAINLGLRVRAKALEAALREAFRLVAARSYNSAWEHLRPYSQPETDPVRRDAWGNVVCRHNVPLPLCNICPI